MQAFCPNLSNKEIKAEFSCNSYVSVDSLIDEIISYPIETKSLVDSLQFLSYIRDKAIKIKK